MGVGSSGATVTGACELLTMGAAPTFQPQKPIFFDFFLTQFFMSQKLNSYYRTTLANVSH